MAYRAYQPARRTRRRRWLLIVLTLVAVVAAIAFLVSRQTEQRGTVEFYAAADSSAALHASASDTLNAALERIGPLMTRQELTRSLSDVSGKAAEADSMLDLEVPVTIGNEYGSISAASRSWVAGTEELESVITAIMDAELTTGAESELQAALDMLRVGDVGYEQFLEVAVVDAETTDITIPVFESVRYIRADDPALYDAQNLVLKIQSAYNLAPRHNVGVVGMTMPEPIGERGGIPLVPFSDTIGVQAIVTNEGNEEETDIEIELLVVGVDTGESLTETSIIDSIDGGAATTVAFADLDLTPGGLYQATLTVRIPIDNDLDNNEWTLTFIWNEES